MKMPETPKNKKTQQSTRKSKNPQNMIFRSYLLEPYLSFVRTLRVFLGDEAETRTTVVSKYLALQIVGPNKL